MKSFLLSLFDNNTPGAATNEVPSTRDLLARGVERVQTEMVDQPLLRADMLTTLGRIHNQLTLYDAAEPPLRKTLTLEDAIANIDPVQRAETARELAQTLSRSSSTPRRRRCCEIHSRRSATVVSCKGRRCIGGWGRLGPDRHVEEGVREVSTALTRLRSIEKPAGKLIGEALADLGAALTRGGKFEESLAPQREALGIVRTLYKGAHADIALVASNIGVSLLNLGRYEEALPVFEEAIAVDRKVFDGPHQRLAIHLSNPGAALAFLYRMDESTTALREGLAIRIALYGASNPEVGKACVNVSNTMTLSEKYAEAEAVARRAIAIFETAPGDWRLWSARSKHKLAYSLLKQNQGSEARIELDGALALFRQVETDPYSMPIMDERALIDEVDIVEGRLQDALTQFETNLSDSLVHLPTNRPRLTNRYQELGKVNFLLDNYAESERNCSEGVRVGGPLIGERSRYTLIRHIGLAQTLVKLGNVDAARELLALLDKVVQGMPETVSLRRQADEVRELLEASPASSGRRANDGRQARHIAFAAVLAGGQCVGHIARAGMRRCDLRCSGFRTGGRLR